MLEAGLYVRVQRAGKWESIDVLQLTEGELAWYINQHPDTGWAWFAALRKWVLANAQPLPPKLPKPKQES